jgi:DivIVA domain-containing protein
MGKKDKATQEQSFAAPATTAASSASSIMGPLDVQQKEFRVSRFGGYKMRDVDEFLDRITDSMSALTVENERLRKGAPPSMIVGTPDLADVSRQADEIIERARAEAARIVAEAKATGPQPDTAASPQERAAVTAFLTREREFLQSLAGLVQEHAEQVRGMAKTAKRAPASPVTPPAEPRAEAPAAKAEAAPTPPAPTSSKPPAAATPAPATPAPAAPATPADAATSKPNETRPATPEPTVRIEDPEPASVGRSESEGEAPAESERSLRDLFWGED